MWLVSARDLQFRARRFVIAVVITSLVFAVALAIDGMQRTMKEEGPAMVALVGADQWLVARGATGPFTANRIVDASAAEEVRDTPGVRRADPVVFGRTVIGADDPKDANLVGHVPGGLGSPPIAQGRAARHPGEVVVSPGTGVSVGDDIVVGGKPFRVVGASDHGRYLLGQSTVFVSLQDAQDMVFNGQPLAMGIAITGHTDDVPAGMKSLTNADVTDDINRPLASGIQMIVVVSVLMWLIAAGIIGLIIYLSATERSRDFAVFKATGAPNRIIVGGLMLQSVIVAVLAAVLALGVSRLVRLGMPLPSDMAASGFVQLLVVSVVVGVLASLTAVRRALTTDPAVAFGGGVMPDIAIRDLTMEYSSGGYVVRPFHHFDLDLATGDLALLLGASGCGKTTLLSMLASILTPTSGSIHVGDTDVTALKGDALAEYRRRTVGVVFQAFNLVPSLTARENVFAALRFAGVKRKEATARSEELLTMVGLEDRMHHRPGKLSGGQQQRVAIARALALDPPLIVADEPTASLDYMQVDGVIRLLRELAAPGRVVVIATHDERLLPLADRVVELTPRPTNETRPPEEEILRPGQVLFRQGDPGDLVFEVEQGRVEIVQEMADGSETLLAVVEPGNYFGELAPMFGLRRSATARAAADAPATVTGYTLRDFRSRRGSLVPGAGAGGATAPEPS